MDPLPIRLLPGQDLRRALEAALSQQGCAAGFVLAGIGSLARTCVRYAGEPAARVVDGAVEILSLSGTVGAGASHLHAVLSGPDGAVFGGHVGYGCDVRTTAEVLLALLPHWAFEREVDPATGFAELVVRRRVAVGPSARPHTP
jgi:predicted DNA-binding protein with PD1-like motif